MYMRPKMVKGEGVEVVGDNIQFLGSRQIPRGNDVLEDDIPPEPEDPSSGVEFTE